MDHPEKHSVATHSPSTAADLSHHKNDHPAGSTDPLHPAPNHPESQNPISGPLSAAESSIIQEKIHQLMKLENLADITLAGYLIKLLRARNKLTYQELYDEVNRCYDTLRRSDGSKYTGDLAKALKGCLTSSEIFKELEGNYWGIREKEAKMYEDKTTKKLKALINRKKGKTLKKSSGAKDALGDIDDGMSNASSNEINDHAGDSPVHEGEKMDVEKSDTHEKPEKGFKPFVIEKPEPVVQEKTLEKVPEIVEVPVVQKAEKAEKPETVEKQAEKAEEKAEKLAGLDKNKKKTKRERESYEKAYNMLDVCLKAIKSNDKGVWVLKNPLKDVRGNESLEELSGSVGHDKTLGMIECFDYFQPVLEDYIKLKGGKADKFANEDLKSLTTNLQDISKKMNIIQEEINKPNQEG